MEFDNVKINKHSDVSSATLTVNGAKIPLLGFGTFGMSGPKLEKVLISALRTGFRHIDTAQMYENETDVGEAVRQAGEPRKDIFITTKVWVGNYWREQFAASVDQSLKNLQSDYIDLLLVHWPRGGAGIKEQIEGLNAAVKAGKTRFIGVSNYNAAMLREAISLSKYPLITNQVEYHPFLDQRILLNEVKASGTSLMAYCGMAIGRVFENLTLKKVAAETGRTIAQVVLRWLIQQTNVVALSRTENISRIEENTRIFDFSLTPEQMELIGNLRTVGSRIVNPPPLAPDWD
jgi:2,5-diketo-D-gluconate reductase B